MSLQMLVLTNNTTTALYNRSQIVKSGRWLYRPPECIEPGNTCVLVVEHQNDSLLQSSPWMARLTYGCYCKEVEYLMAFEFKATSNFPAIFNLDSLQRKCVASLGIGELTNPMAKAGAPGSPEIFSVQIFSTPDKTESEFIASETVFGATYMEQMRKSNEVMPINFFRQSSPTHSNWLSNLRKADRSIHIRIVNLSSHTLSLVYRSKPKGPPTPSTNLIGNRRLTYQELHILPLLEGVWQEYPAEEIGPLKLTNFGVRGRPFHGNIGDISYSVSGCPGTITFKWSQKYGGPFEFHASHSTKKLICVGHCNDLYDGVLSFHVFDPFNSPPMTILTAKCVWEEEGEAIRQQPAEYIPRLKDSDAPDVREQVLQLLDIQSRGKDHPGGETLLDIGGIQSFFATGRSSRSSKGSPLGDPSSCLFLEWQIGCEVFASVWSPNKRLRLDSSLPGGGLIGSDIDPATVILNGRAVRHSAHLTARRSLPIEGSETVAYLDGLISAMQILSEAIQNALHELLAPKYGNAWLSKCDINEDAFWDLSIRGTERFLDIEGVLQLLHSYWVTDVGQIVKDERIINEILAGAINWANQNLEDLTPMTIGGILHNGRLLLQLLKCPKAAASLENIARSLGLTGGPTPPRAYNLTDETPKPVRHPQSEGQTPPPMATPFG